MEGLPPSKANGLIKGARRIFFDKWFLQSGLSVMPTEAKYSERKQCASLASLLKGPRINVSDGKVFLKWPISVSLSNCFKLINLFRK